MPRRRQTRPHVRPSDTFLQMLPTCRKGPDLNLLVWARPATSVKRSFSVCEGSDCFQSHTRSWSNWNGYDSQTDERVWRARVAVSGEGRRLFGTCDGDAWNSRQTVLQAVNKWGKHSQDHKNTPSQSPMTSQRSPAHLR